MWKGCAFDRFLEVGKFNNLMPVSYKLLSPVVIGFEKLLSSEFYSYKLYVIKTINICRIKSVVNDLLSVAAVTLAAKVTVTGSVLLST
jgi:hypothetical protein